MTSPLEPTAEQIDKIATAISVASSDSYALENPRDVELEGAARAMWRLIAPMVLEAAEQACEQVRSKVEPASLDIPLLEFTQKDHEAAGVLKCIAAIRAMKGTGAVDPEVFTCPACGIVSHNPNDARHRYCARCERFFPAARPTDRDRERLAKGAAALTLPDPVTLEEMVAQREQVHDAVRAMQSLDDLGSPEANEAAWRDMEALEKKAAALRARLKGR